MPVRVVWLFIGGLLGTASLYTPFVAYTVAASYARSRYHGWFVARWSSARRSNGEAVPSG